MPPSVKHFILIDDSTLDCFISQKVIKNILPDCFIRCFNEAQGALDHIRDSPFSKQKTIILLDIQMPVMNGFEFAAAFEKLPSTVKSGYVIYMVSSSTNEMDRIRIGNFSCIRHLYKKPLNKVVVQELIDDAIYA